MSIKRISGNPENCHLGVSMSNNNQNTIECTFSGELSGNESELKEYLPCNCIRPGSYSISYEQVSNASECSFSVNFFSTKSSVQRTINFGSRFEKNRWYSVNGSNLNLSFDDSKISISE